MVPTQLHNPAYKSIDLRHFLGIFAKFRRQAVSFIMSVFPVCPYVLMEQLGSHWAAFPEMLFEYCSQDCRES